MTSQRPKTYLFGPFRLETGAYRLFRDGEPVHLTPKAFDTLVFLIEERPRLVGKGELLAQVWHGESVSENVVYQAITTLKRVLGKRPDGGEYVENVPRKGYWFTAEVEELAPHAARPVSRRGAVKSSSTSCLVGREKEMADLWKTTESVEEGVGHLLCVTGEPGIGKTTLVESFLNEVASGDLTCDVARGKCSERFAGTGAYLPFLDALESLIEGGGAEAVADLMKQLAPSWYVQVAPPDARPRTAEEAGGIKVASQERLKREASAFLLEISRRRPLILFLDDLHWADESTVDLLAYLATKFESMRVLVVATYRPSVLLKTNRPILRMQKGLQTHNLCHELALGLLSIEDITRYMALESPDSSFSPEIPKFIHDKTQGNPLFVVDLLSYLRERKVVVKEQDRWTLAKPVQDVWRELPESVRSMVEIKIDQLNETERRLMDVACVQGYEFDSTVLAHVLDMGVAEVEECLYKLEHVNAFVWLITQHEFPDGTVTRRYQFVHLFYQEALYDLLQRIPARKSTLSAAVARALLGHYGEQSSAIALQLARLLKEAQDPAQAFHYFALAANNALRMSAFSAVHSIAKSGLAITGSVPDGPSKNEDELSLLNTLGMSVMAIRGFAAPELQDIYEKSVELCKQSEDSKWLPIALYGLWVFHIDGGRLKTAHELGEQILEYAERRDDAVALVESHYTLGTTLLQLGNLRGAREHLSKGISGYDRRSHASNRFYYQNDPGVMCLCQSARASWLLGFPDEALRTIKAALELARDIEHYESHAYALTFCGDIHHFRGELREAAKYLDMAIQLSLEQGLIQESNWARIMRGWILVEQGHVEDGIAELQRNLARDRESGSEVARSKFLGLLARALGKAGKVRDGIRVLDEAFSFVKATSERYCESELFRIKGELLQMQPRTGPAAQGEAEACVMRAIEIARRQGSKSFELRATVSLTRLFIRQRRSAKARLRLEKVYRSFTEGSDTSDLREAQALLKELS